MSHEEHKTTEPRPDPPIEDWEEALSEEEDVDEQELEADAQAGSAHAGETVDLSPNDQQELSNALVPTTSLQRYLAEVRRYPFLSKEEEQQLVHEHRDQGSAEAAVRLILANLRVSVAIASEYFHTGADPMDLIQEGNVGLMQAIRKFDPTKNVRFHAYAAWWVRAYILRYLLGTFRLVKIGTTQDQRKLFYNLKKEKANLERQGFVPDAKLLADRLQVRERDVIEMDQRLGSWELSLDQPLTEDSEGTLLDILPSQTVGVDEQLANTELRMLFREKLTEFIKQLNEREEDILRNRILSETPLTLDEIGEKYGITKERARQLESKVIKRLRDDFRKDLKDFDQLRS